MFPVLALSSNVAVGLLALGSVTVVISGLWTLVVAAQRGILWLLAVLLLPVTQLVLLFVEPKSRRPFVVSLIGFGLMFGGVLGMEDDQTGGGNVLQRIVQMVKSRRAGTDAPAESPAALAAAGSLGAHKARVRQWQAELEARKAALKPGDAAAQAAFNEELQRYLAELEKVKAEDARPKN